MPLLSLGLLNDENQSRTPRGEAAQALSPTPTPHDTVVARGERMGGETADSAIQVSESALPAAIEELRTKISAGLTPAVRARTEGSDFSVVSNPGSVPTFATFKFGYLPGRGLLYSAIAHELALFGL